MKCYNRSRRVIQGALRALLVGAALLLAAPVAAQDQRLDPLHDVGFDQRLDAQTPLDALFVDEEGRTVAFGDYFGEKPVLLALNYYECPMLCSIVREGVLTSLQQLDFDVGREFTVIFVSIDPTETPMIAAAQKAATVARYGRPGAAEGWHFLTGSQESIDQLAQAVGFRYVYDEPTAQYSHPSGVVILTPQGRVARYFYGIEYVSRDLRLGLVEASHNKIGSPIDQLLLLCFHYDPVTGRYSGLIMTITQVAGALTVLMLGITMFVLTRRHRRRPIELAH